MAFTITPPHGLLGAEGAGVQRPAGGILGGAVKRDALAELRQAFVEANGKQRFSGEEATAAAVL